MYVINGLQKYIDLPIIAFFSRKNSVIQLYKELYEEFLAICYASIADLLLWCVGWVFVGCFVLPSFETGIRIYLLQGTKISMFDDAYICITRHMLIIQVEKIIFWKLQVSERSKLGDLRI